MLQTTADLVFFKDLELRYIACSEAFYTFNGLTAAEVLGKTLIDIIGTEIGEAHQENDRTIIESGVRTREEIKVTAPTGETRLFDLIVSPVKNESGAVIGLMGIGRDISMLRMGQQELAQKNRDLIKSTAELDALVYRAAHDLRAPVTNMLGINSLLSSAKDQEDRMQLLALQNAELSKLDGFIHQIVDLTRNKRLNATWEKMNIEPFLTQIFQSLSTLRGFERIRFSVKVENDAAYYSDSLRLGLIFEHLLRNAIVFQRLDIDAPYLVVEVELNPKTALFRVKDNGIGIAAEMVEKIFDMFYRGNSQSIGSGLGLYIVRDAVNFLKGKISVASVQGIGSVFEVILPNQLFELAESD